MKCEIVRDLLPIYIDGLASGESVQAVEEHMRGCAQCRRCLEEMRGCTLELPKPPEIRQPAEFKFLKKLRKRWRAILWGSGALLAAVLLGVKAFIIGFPVRMEDIDIHPEVNQENFEVTLQLKGGSYKRLYFAGSKWESKEITLRPYWAVRLPFDDASNSCMLGYSLTREEGEEPYRMTLIFADGEKIYVNGAQEK